MRVFERPHAIDEAVGEHLGFSEWRTITQESIDTFANVTGDRQWIHVDPVRSVAGPYGSPIAHGYLTLSMIGGWSGEIFEVRGCSMIVNYGLESVRFLSPVLVGSRVRAGAMITAVTPISGGRRTTVAFTVEIEHSDKPALVAQTVLLAFADEDDSSEGSS